MSRIKDSFKAIGEALNRFFTEVVRTVLLPFPFLKNTRIHAWANRNEPEDPEERRELNKRRIFRYISLALAIGLIAICLLIFGNPIPRAVNSFRYAGESFAYAFGIWTEAEENAAPQISNALLEQFEGLLANVKGFWFYFQASVGALTNKDVAYLWWHDFMNGLINILRFVDWIPIIVIAFKLLANAYTSEKEEDIGKSKPLTVWEEKIVPKFIRPTKAFFLEFLDYFTSARWVKAVFITSILTLCIVGWTAFDIVISYLLMIMTFDFGWFPTFFASFLVDVVVFFLKIGVPGAVIVILCLLLTWRRKRAVAMMAEMQSKNEEIAKSLPNITAINGPIGTGKTTMMSSIADDMEGMLRDSFLKDMRRYTAAFPRFEWTKLEAWVMAAARKDGMNLNNRAKIKAGIAFVYSNWKKSGYKVHDEDGCELFFGYDRDYGMTWHDGAKKRTLLDAVQIYAQSFFMYYTGDRICFSNYPIAFEKNMMGRYFHVYQPSSIFVFERVPRPRDDFSHVLDMDYFRILKTMEKSERKRGFIDAGVIAMTEGSNERGNRFDYVGLSKSDDAPNPKNDGYNKYMRLLRHDCTIDGTPRKRMIYDYQRGESMNAEVRDSAEDTITIMARGEEDNVLPLWSVEDFICSFIEAKWTNYYWYTWKPNRLKETLLNRFLAIFCGIFINRKARARNLYGYEIITFNREHGGMNGLTGQRTIEHYYSIFRKTRSNLFNTAVYGPIMDQRAVTALNGWTDTPTYKSDLATIENFESQHSYFYKGLENFVDKKASKSVMEKIAKATNKGSESPFYLLPEEEMDKDDEDPVGEGEPS